MTKILIVIDVQNGFINKYTKDIATRISNLLEKNVFDYVIGTRFINKNNSIYERLLNWSKLKTKEEIEIVDCVKDKIDTIVDKSINNCISDDFLQRLCSINGGDCPEEVYLAGLNTECCVLLTAFSLFDNNIRPVVLEKYCGSHGGPDRHNAGLVCMRAVVGNKQVSDVEF